MSHAEGIRRDKEFFEELKLIADSFSTPGEKEEMREKFIVYAGILQTNVIGLPSQDKLGDLIGSALYIGASYFDLWYRPNAIFNFTGNG